MIIIRTNGKNLHRIAQQLCQLRDLKKLDDSLSNNLHLPYVCSATPRNVNKFKHTHKKNCKLEYICSVLTYLCNL